MPVDLRAQLVPESRFAHDVQRQQLHHLLNVDPDLALLPSDRLLHAVDEHLRLLVHDAHEVVQHVKVEAGSDELPPLVPLRPGGSDQAVADPRPQVVVVAALGDVHAALQQHLGRVRVDHHDVGAQADPEHADLVLCDRGHAVALSLELSEKLGRHVGQVEDVAEEGPVLERDPGDFVEQAEVADPAAYLVPVAGQDDAQAAESYQRRVHL